MLGVDALHDAGRRRGRSPSDRRGRRRSVFCAVRTQIEPDERAADRTHACLGSTRACAPAPRLGEGADGSAPDRRRVTTRRVGPVDDRRPVPAQQDVAGMKVAVAEAIAVSQGIQRRQREGGDARREARRRRRSSSAPARGGSASRRRDHVVHTGLGAPDDASGPWHRPRTSPHECDEVGPVDAVHDQTGAPVHHRRCHRRSGRRPHRPRRRASRPLRARRVRRIARSARQT